MLVHRLNPGDASFDPSSSSDGRATFPDGGSEAAWDVELQGTRRILVAGFSRRSGDDGQLFVGAASPTGQVDTGLGAEGVTALDPGPGDDRAYDIAVDGSGRVLLAGWAVGGTGATDIVLARLQADGQRDSSLGANGVIVGSPAKGDDKYIGIALEGNDRAVVVGQVDEDGDAVEDRAFGVIYSEAAPGNSGSSGGGTPGLPLIGMLYVWLVLRRASPSHGLGSTRSGRATRGRGTRDMSVT